MRPAPTSMPAPVSASPPSCRSPPSMLGVSDSSGRDRLGVPLAAGGAVGGTASRAKMINSVEAQPDSTWSSASASRWSMVARTVAGAAITRAANQHRDTLRYLQERITTLLGRDGDNDVVAVAEVDVGRATGPPRPGAAGDDDVVAVAEVDVGPAERGHLVAAERPVEQQPDDRAVDEPPALGGLRALEAAARHSPLRAGR